MKGKNKKDEMEDEPVESISEDGELDYNELDEELDDDQDDLDDGAEDKDGW